LLISERYIPTVFELYEVDEVDEVDEKPRNKKVYNTYVEVCSKKCRELAADEVLSSVGMANIFANKILSVRI